MATYGIEEEVFVTEPERPTLKSLYYLARLLWKNPRRNYFYTASNFARGQDIKQGLMSGIEIATDAHSDVESLMADFVSRRRELIEVVDGLIVPLGHLINYSAPTNTCALQLHIGDVEDMPRVYRNLTHFLPILVLLTINAPYSGGRYFGQSFRIASSYAIGLLEEDWTARFQDIIFARRLRTIEVRVFDPVWDLNRVRILVEAIDRIVNFDGDLGLDIEQYNRWRGRIVREGYLDELDDLYIELSSIYNVPKDLLFRTPANEVRDFYEKNGLVKTYSALDNAYRNGVFESRPIPEIKGDSIKAALGFAGYYIPKLPYILWKFWRES